MANSARSRSRMPAAEGSASRTARVWRACASDQRRTSSASPSSSQRYGSGTATPCRTSTVSPVGVGGGSDDALIEAALAAADVAPAALGLERPAPLERWIEVARRGGAVRRRPARARTVARASRGPVAAGAAAHARRTRRPVLGLVHPQRTALEVLPVHQADRLLRRLVVLELHEGEPSWASGLPVGGDLGIHHLAGRAEGLDQLIARDVEAQVSDEDLVRNGRLSSINDPTARCHLSRGDRTRSPGRGSRGRRTVAESRGLCRRAAFSNHLSTRELAARL